MSTLTTHSQWMKIKGFDEQKKKRNGNSLI